MKFISESGRLVDGQPLTKAEVVAYSKISDILEPYFVYGSSKFNVIASIFETFIITERAPQRPSETGDGPELPDAPPSAPEG